MNVKFWRKRATPITLLDAKNQQVLLKKIIRLAANTAVNYQLLVKNDRILVGLSFGKDSWTLLATLEQLRKKAPVKFEFEAIHINTMFSEEIPLANLKKTCEKYCKLHILDVPFEKIINENDNGRGNFCSFCSRLRRGHIYSFAQEHNFNKIALGHHREDTLETCLMNLFFSGQLKAIPPIYKTDDHKLEVIRPLIEVPEELITEFCSQIDFPIITDNCPFLTTENDGKRYEIKQLLNQLEKKYPHLKSHFLNSLKNVRRSHLF